MRLPDPTQLTVEEMKRKLTAAIPISPEELETLGHQRAEAIRHHLLKGGTLTEE
jgi:hypothetical protein